MSHRRTTEKRAGAGVPRGVRARRAFLVVLAAAGGLVPFGRAPAQQALGPGEEKAFSHAGHVPRQWTLERFLETERDCLGCHEDPRAGKAPAVRNAAAPDGTARADGSAARPANGTEPVCSRCHYEGFAARNERPPLLEGRSSFRHPDHKFPCASCHLPDRAGEIPADLPVPAGIATCIACHDPGAPEPDEVAVREIDDFIALLNRPEVESLGPRSYGAPAGEAAGGETAGNGAAAGGFHHADHVPGWPDADPSRWREVCAGCHASLAGSRGLDDAGTSDLGEDLFDPSACARCHIAAPAPGGNAPRPRRFALARRGSASASAGTFAHADHLAFLEPFSAAPGAGGADEGAPELADSRARLDREGCLACHRAAPEPRAGDDFLATESASYDGCVACHRTWKLSENRGEVAGLVEPEHAGIEREMSRCAPCHVLGFAADPETARPLVETERTYPPFAFLEETHPFVHDRGGAAGEVEDAKGAAPPEACADCHRARLEEDPSRLARSDFRHATHLPRAEEGTTPAALSARCDGCHPAVARSSGAEELSRAAYSLDGCSTCHEGGEPRAVRHAGAASGDEGERAGEGVERGETRGLAERNELPSEDEPPAAATSLRRVPLFAHADHVGKPLAGEDRAMRCADCHPVDLEDGRAEVGLLDEARACVPCHDHARTPLATGKVSGRWVESCRRCHRRGIPAGGEPLLEELPVIASVEGRQHHPSVSGEIACRDCHATQIARGLRLRPPPGPQVFGTGTYQPGGGFHRRHRFPRLEGKRAGCLGCHWGKPNARTTCDMQPPDLASVRKRYGGRLDGFPGRTADPPCAR